MALSKKDIDTRYAKLPGMRKPLSEPMNRQDANPYITPTTLVTIILRLKLITIAPKQVVIKTITQASIPNPIAKLRNREIPPPINLSVPLSIATSRPSTTYETLAKSRYLPQIENRFEPLALIEQLLDDNRLVFRYNAKLNQFSLIEADYLLSTPLENSDIYIFIAEHKDTGKYFCRSFFPKEKKDYTEGQPRYTMLYKEKKNLTTGETIIQYDRLTPKTQA